MNFFKNKIQVTLAMLCFFITACNHNKKASLDRTQLNTKTESYTYNFPSCQNGPRTFTSKEAYCQALEEELWNNQCEHQDKEILFKADCSTSVPPVQSINKDLNESAIPSQDSRKTSVPTSKVVPTIDKMDILAKFEQPPTFTRVPTDNGSTYNMMNASFKPFSPVKKLPDTINIGKASTHTFISPPLDGCIIDSFDFPYISEYNSHDSIFSLGANDGAYSTNCQKFMERISSDGLHMQFSDVPLLNGNGAVIKVVDLIITN